VKIGVLADSHDHLTNLQKAVVALKGHKIDLLIHAGDFVAPFSVPYLGLAECPVWAVYGNNDGERVGLKIKFQELDGRLHERPFSYEHERARILVQHEPIALETLEGCKQYDLVVYGHTHAVDIRIPNQGAMIVNPGEVCGWLTDSPTCAVVDLSTRQVEVIQIR
jgi:uncharacterized protein